MTIEERFAALDARIAERDAAFEAATEKIDRLEATIAESAQLRDDDIREAIDSAESRLHALEDQQKTERAMTWFALSQFAEAHPDDEFARRLKAGEFDKPRPAEEGAAEAAACAGCGHAGLSHWELSEPEGMRKGCGILGCPCIVYAA